MPIILIRKLGRSSGKGTVRENLAGFDVIVPSGMARFLWHALVWHGARAIGLDEWQQYHLEAGLPYFPDDFPDVAHPAAESSACVQINWRSLFRAEGSSQEQDDVDSQFVVVRGRHYTAPFVVHSIRPATARLPERTPRSTRKGRWVVRGRPAVTEERVLPTLPFNTLVLVWVVAAAKGTPRPGDEISTPSPEDYERWNWHEARMHQPTTNGESVKRWGGCHEARTGRKLVGFVTSGGRSFTYGTGVALGHCDAEALFFALQESGKATTGEGKHMLLFKDAASQIHYPCFVHIFS